MSLPEHRLVRSRRRTIGLQIAPDATLVVRAPLRATEAAIEAVLRQHLDWVLRTQRKVAARPRPPAVRGAAGETFLYLGNAYEVRLAANQKKPVVFQDGFVLRERDAAHGKRHLEAWYKHTAREVLTQRVKLYAAVDERFRVKGLRISGARTRWGSCSTRGNVNFSWRLLQAPLKVIDYVVVHELAHLVYHNHSAAFWALVEHIMPGYREQKDWLRAHGHVLHW